MKLSKLFQFDFDEQERNKPIGEFVSELHDQLIVSTRARGVSADGLSVISLSGGQDSRAVAAAMKAANTPCVAATFLTPNRHSGRDAKLAEQIAAALGIAWTLISVPEATAAQQQRLICMTGGQNLVSMAFILPFMDAIVERWGRNAMYFTGDGGDKIFPRISPGQAMGDVDTLVAHLVYQHALIPSGDVERIFHLDEGELKSEMRSLVMSYPEQDLGHKYVHYIVYERGRKWLFEGEDRARFFLWQTTPFYSFPLFQQAMRVPDTLKSHNILYRKLQIRLSPQAACIPDQTYGLPASSWLFPWTVRLHEYGMKIPRKIRKPIQRVLQHSPLMQPSMTIAAQIRNDSIMDPDAVREMLRSSSPSAFQSWATLDMLETTWRSARKQKELQAS